jgi:hypothetical protein
MEKNLAAALASAQGRFKPAERDAENPHFHNRYASLGSVIDAVREALAKEGIAITQGTRVDGDRIYLTTALRLGDEVISSEYPVAPVTATPQQVGSALTYARRYSLSSLLVVATGDAEDDGNEAENIRQPPAKRPSPAPASPPAEPPNLGKLEPLLASIRRRGAMLGYPEQKVESTITQALNIGFRFRDQKYERGADSLRCVNDNYRERLKDAGINEDAPPPAEEAHPTDAAPIPDPEPADQISMFTGRKRGAK